MEALSPNIFVNDLNKTIAFYKILGFDLILTVPEKGNFDFALMTCGKVTFMFQTFASLGSELPEIKRGDGASLLLYINVKDIKTYFNSIKNKVKIIKWLEKTFYGATEFSIRDLNGYILTFAEDE